MNASRAASVAVVILAAGKGTRMRSPLPKVLHLAAGRTLVGHVAAACAPLAERGAGLFVVVAQGDEGQAVAAAVPWAEPIVQAEQRGTGHALATALARLSPQGTVVVLNGDMPLVTADLVETLLDSHLARDSAASLVSAVAADPAGLGRVVRDGAGAFVRVVEEADASEAERRICEINAGLYAFDLGRLHRAIGRLGADNAQGEMYLPDLFPLFMAEAGAVGVVAAPDWETVAGVNTQGELARAAAALFRRRARRLGQEGVAIEAIDGVRVEAGATVEAGAVLGVGTLIGAASTVRRGARVSDARVERARIASGSVVRAGTWIAPPQGGAGSGAKGREPASRVPDA